MKTLSTFWLVALVACTGIVAPVAGQPTDQRAHEDRSRVGEMSEDVVRARLTAAGYANVQNLKRDGADFIAEATRAGAPVKIKMNAVTGKIAEASP